MHSRDNYTYHAGTLCQQGFVRNRNPARDRDTTHLPNCADLPVDGRSWRAFSFHPFSAFFHVRRATIASLRLKDALRMPPGHKTI